MSEPEQPPPGEWPAPVPDVPAPNLQPPPGEWPDPMGVPEPNLQTPPA